MIVSARTWRALCIIAETHDESRGFLAYEVGGNFFGAGCNHLTAYWWW